MKINLSQEDINTNFERSSMMGGDRASHHSLVSNALPDIYQAKYINSVSKNSDGSDKHNSSERPPRESSFDIEVRLRKEKRNKPMIFGNMNHRYPNILERSALVQKN